MKFTRHILAALLLSAAMAAGCGDDEPDKPVTPPPASPTPVPTARSGISIDPFDALAMNDPCRAAAIAFQSPIA